MHKVPAVLTLVAAAMLGMVSTVVSAQNGAASKASQPAQGDPNQIICESNPVTGSRLAKKRICMTRAQWADYRLENRQELERAQVRRPMTGSSGD